MLAEMTDFSGIGGGFAFGLGLYRVIRRAAAGR